MLEQEKSELDVANKSSMVVVEQEQSAGSRHKPYRPTDLQDEQPELHHKRSKAPAVPSVAEKLKNQPDATIQEDKSARKIQEHLSSEKHKHLVSKTSRSKKQGSTTSPETIALTALEVKEKVAVSSQPIPADVKSISSAVSEPIKPVGKKPDEDSITEDIADLQTPQTTRKISEWSDEEEAGGLPRSDSRASRVSRAVRQLFCCGTAYSPPSEADVSTHRISSGI